MKFYSIFTISNQLKQQKIHEQHCNMQWQLFLLRDIFPEKCLEMAAELNEWLTSEYSAHTTDPVRTLQQKQNVCINPIVM